MNFGFLQTLAIFALIFTILVFFHELGHFLAAKWMKMRVEEFGFGLPIPGTKRLFRFAFDGQTEYTVWPVLMGGFVRIKGMEIEDGIPADTKGVDEEHRATRLETTNVGTMEQETQEVSGADNDGFNARPIYQRFIVILAGPVFSFLLGWLAFCLIGVIFGLPDKAMLTVGEVKPNTIAASAGLKAGDTLIGLNGKRIDDGVLILKAIQGSPGKPIGLTIKAPSGDIRDVAVTPKADQMPGDEKPVGRIGFAPSFVPLTYKRVTVAESFAFGNGAVGSWFQQMVGLFRSGAIKDSVGGPVAIFRTTQTASKGGASEVMSLLAQLSLSLGLFNLFPIPVLDGGHLTLMILEAIRRRKLTAEQTARVFTAGFALLAVMTVVILFKDIFLRG